MKGKTNDFEQRNSRLEQIACSSRDTMYTRHKNIMFLHTETIRETRFSYHYYLLRLREKSLQKRHSLTNVYFSVPGNAMPATCTRAVSTSIESFNSRLNLSSYVTATVTSPPFSQRELNVLAAAPDLLDKVWSVNSN